MAVKSALRVIQILEYFDEVQRALTARQMAVALSWPASSTWGLLRTLVESGYLSFDAMAKTYLPTERVSVLGLWAYTPLFGEGRLLKLMRDLRARTRGRIVLAAQAGNLVRYIHTVQGSKPGSWHFRRGMPHSMFETSVGRLFLSLYQDQEVARIIHRLNGERAPGQPQIKVEQVLRELVEIRRSGFSVSNNRLAKGYGTISMLLPRIYGQGRPLAIGITTSSDMIVKRQADFSNQIKAAIRRHLGDLAG